MASGATLTDTNSADRSDPNRAKNRTPDSKVQKNQSDRDLPSEHREAAREKLSEERQPHHPHEPHQPHTVRESPHEAVERKEAPRSVEASHENSQHLVEPGTVERQIARTESAVSQSPKVESPAAGAITSPPSASSPVATVPSSAVAPLAAAPVVAAPSQQSAAPPTLSPPTSTQPIVTPVLSELPQGRMPDLARAEIARDLKRSGTENDNTNGESADPHHRRRGQLVDLNGNLQAAAQIQNGGLQRYAEIQQALNASAQERDRKNKLALSEPGAHSKSQVAQGAEAAPRGKDIQANSQAVQSALKLILEQQARERGQLAKGPQDRKVDNKGVPGSSTESARRPSTASAGKAEGVAKQIGGAQRGSNSAASHQSAPVQSKPVQSGKIQVQRAATVADGSRTDSGKQSVGRSDVASRLNGESRSAQRVGATDKTRSQIIPEVSRSGEPALRKESPSTDHRQALDRGKERTELRANRSERVEASKGESSARVRQQRLLRARDIQRARSKKLADRKSLLRRLQRRRLAALKKLKKQMRMRSRRGLRGRFGRRGGRGRATGRSPVELLQGQQVEAALTSGSAPMPKVGRATTARGLKK